MKEVMIQKLDLEFIDKANLTTREKIGSYLGELYEYSLDDFIEYETTSSLVQKIPTRYMIVKSGWHSFEELYIDYCYNGHDPSQLSTIMENLDDGIQIDEILDGWRDWKYYNSGFSLPYTSDDLEGALIRDILKVLDLFNLTYLIDDNEDIYSNPEGIDVKDWVNPPIKKVW